MRFLLLLLLSTTLQAANIPTNYSGGVVFDVATGKIPGELQLINGYNGDVDTDYEDISPMGGNYNWPASAGVLRIWSADAADGGAGTGALTMLIEGLDASRLPISETVSLNGLTVVDSALTTYLRVNRVCVVTAGSYGSNVGLISVSHTATSNLVAAISVNHGCNTSARWSIPANRTGYIFDMLGTTSGGQDGHLELMLRAPGKAWQAKGSTTGFRSSMPFFASGYGPIAAGSDINFRGEALAVGNLTMSLNAMLVLLP